MRYEKIIYLVKEGEEVYNPLTGNYDEPKEEKIERLANISGLGPKSKALMFGEITQETLVFRLKGDLDGFDYIEYGSTLYRPIEVNKYPDETVIYGVIK